ncbi:hypothetical protein BC826DRAFT_1110301 [Russula brevipes]|nr:hypothetical protein BC826DRAFT_1110301 [Russula brevipes]
MASFVCHLFTSQRGGVLNGITVYQSILFGASVSSGVCVLISSPPKLRISWNVPVLLLHSLAFLSNSYTFWEDRVIPFFLLFTLVPPLLTALSAPTAHLRHRILSAARSSIHGCRVTFFSGSGAAEAPALVRKLLIPAAALVPYGIRRVLAISKSDNGIASFLLPYIVPPALIAGSASSTSVLAVLVGTALWALVPVALHVSSERAAAGDGHKTEVRILGFANAYGVPFAVLWGLALAPVWLAAQPSAQIPLALATAALLTHLELVDAARDAQALHAGFAADPAGALARLQQGLRR